MTTPTPDRPTDRHGATLVPPDSPPVPQTRIEVPLYKLMCSLSSTNGQEGRPLFKDPPSSIPIPLFHCVTPLTALRSSPRPDHTQSRSSDRDGDGTQVDCVLPYTGLRTPRVSLEKDDETSSKRSTSGPVWVKIGVTDLTIGYPEGVYYLNSLSVRKEDFSSALEGGRKGSVDLKRQTCRELRN